MTGNPSRALYVVLISSEDGIVGSSTPSPVGVTEYGPLIAG
jgi:hypothetical protein